MRLSETNKQYLYGTLLFAVIVLAAALAHRLFLGSKYYVGNPLIVIEVAGVVALLLSVPVSLVMGLYFLVKRQWTNLVLALIVAAIAFLSALLAMQIDYPTLIFAT